MLRPSQKILRYVAEVELIILAQGISSKLVMCFYLINPVSREKSFGAFQIFELGDNNMEIGEWGNLCTQRERERAKKISGRMEK